MQRGIGDGFLSAALAYPRSMAAVLLSARRLLRPSPAGAHTPPLLAFGISLVLYFVGEGIVSRVELAEPGGIDFPSLGAVVAIVLWILVVLAVAQSTLAKMFGLRPEPQSPGLLALLWPVSVGLLASGVLTMAAVWFPQAAVSAAAAIDSGYRDLPDSWTFPMTWTHAIATVSAPVVLVFSAWAFFNVVRNAFAATRLRAALATVTTMTFILIVTILLVTVAGGITWQLYFWTNP